MLLKCVFLTAYRLNCFYGRACYACRLFLWTIWWLREVLELFSKVKRTKTAKWRVHTNKIRGLGPPRLWNHWTETVTAIDLLKTRKVPGVDNNLCELLKHGKEALKGSVTILFNNILISGRYPMWSHGLIVPIFKKDDPSNPENYRGIIYSLISNGKDFYLNNE